MPLVGHLPELLGVLLVGLLVFGPKRMIEMGSTLGKAVREMRESLKDIPGFGGSGMQTLLGQDEPQRTPFVATSQMPPTPVATPAPADATEPSVPAEAATSQAVPPASTEVVEGSVVRVVEMPED